jgi:hypothetical protein
MLRHIHATLNTTHTSFLAFILLAVPIKLKYISVISRVVYVNIGLLGFNTMHICGYSPEDGGSIFLRNAIY